MASFNRRNFILATVAAGTSASATSFDNEKSLASSSPAPSGHGNLPSNPSPELHFGSSPSISAFSSTIEGMGADLIPTSLKRVESVLHARSLTEATKVKLLYVDGNDGGLFRRDHSDTTSAENGGIHCGTIIRSVDYSLNGVWKRVHDGVASATWFGATGDFSNGAGTDNAAAFTQINSLINNGTIRAWYFPSGSYLTTVPLGDGSTKTNSARISGENLLSTSIVFRNCDGIKQRFYGLIENLTLDGENAASGRYTGIRNSYQTEIHNVRITRFWNGLSNLQSLKKADKLFIDRCIFGVILDGGKGFSDSGEISQVWLNNNVVGVEQISGQALNYSLRHVFFQANVVGISIGAHGTAILSRYNCWCEQAGNVESRLSTPNTQADTTLTSAISHADPVGAQFTVDDASKWPHACIACVSPSGRSGVVINGGEWFYVTRSENTFTIQARAQGGTIATNHAINAGVWIIPTFICLGAGAGLTDYSPHFSGAAQGGEVVRVSERAKYRRVNSTGDHHLVAHQMMRASSPHIGVSYNLRSLVQTMLPNNAQNAGIIAKIALPSVTQANGDNHAYQQALIKCKVNYIVARTDIVGTFRSGVYEYYFRASRSCANATLTVDSAKQTNIHESDGFTVAPTISTTVDNNTIEVRLTSAVSSGLPSAITASTTVEVDYSGYRWGDWAPAIS